MKTVELCICDKCLNPIIDENQGFIVHGNIYCANPNELGGLIGNNFKDDKVEKAAFCKKCFCEILNINDGTPILA